MSDKKFIVIGAGPAGLAATYMLSKQSIPAVCLEADTQVGGLSRTVEYKGFRFDIGGHRFFTKIREVDALWREVLDTDYLRRPRLSRIYYRNKFFNYPLKPVQALFGLGLLESVRILGSYAAAKIHPSLPEKSFEHWVSNRFGKRLFAIFFKTYTEKVWGLPCTELSAEWAAQRIKSLSLVSALMNALFKRSGKGQITTLIEEFDYPRLGPGQMYETMAAKVEKMGNQVVMGHKVIKLCRDGEQVLEAIAQTDGGRTESFSGTDFVSTMPLSELVLAMDPPAPKEVRVAAENLSYRSIITVNLLIDREKLFPDTWIYVHSPEVRIGRIQCYKNWSPYMVPDPSKSSLGLEYFATEGDDLWNTPDEELIRLGSEEISRLGLCSRESIMGAFVVRMAKAYPVYDSAYVKNFKCIPEWVKTLRNLQPCGRYGLFRYNNADHSILSAMYAVRTLLGEEGCNVWSVNTEEEYHEEDRGGDAGARP